MDEGAPDRQPPQIVPSEDRLDSWKEIASYLKRDVTTVQRWEKRERMPVHRHLHDKLGTVYAFRADLDTWARGRNLRAAGEQEASVADGPDDPTGIPAGLDELPLAVPVVSTGAVAGSAGTAASTSSRPSRWKRWLATGVGVVVATGAVLWLRQGSVLFQRDLIADARFAHLTDFAGVDEAATISRDGRFVAFLSDRDGPIDVWLTQVGTGEFHNLTRGGFKELVNPSVRSLGFSPDGSQVTFWTRKGDGSKPGDIGIWAVPILGGQPRPYLEGVAEFDWSDDGTRLVYHTPGPGDPMFVRDHGGETEDRQIFVAPAGLHGHFPLWAPNEPFIYFVQGSLPDSLDIWRIKAAPGPPERITYHNSRVSHPVFLDRRTLMYLATEPDGSGPRLYSIDVERRTPHRIGSGLDTYTSLAASADGHRLVATETTPKGLLWRSRLQAPALQRDKSQVGEQPIVTSAATRIPLTTGSGIFPRLGSNYLLYVSSKGASEGIWKLADGITTEVWSAAAARVIGGPAISPDGERIAFAVEQGGRTIMYVASVDGGAASMVTDSLALQGAPAWAPDGQSIVQAALDDGVPRLYRLSLDGKPPVRYTDEYSVDPVWSPDGRFMVYSGPDIGTTFSVKAIGKDGKPYPMPELTLTRGARHLRFLPGQQTLVMMRGEIDHKNLWSIDLDNGSERQLTDLDREFHLRDFDISPDGHDIVLDQVQQQSDLVLIEVPAR